MINPSKIILSSEMPGLPTLENTQLYPSGSPTILANMDNYIGTFFPYNTVGMTINQFQSTSQTFTYPGTIPPGGVLRVVIAISQQSSTTTVLVGNMAQTVFPLGPGGVAPFHDTVWNYYVSQVGNSITVTVTRYNNGGAGLFASGTGSPNIYIFGTVYSPPF